MGSRALGVVMAVALLLLVLTSTARAGSRAFVDPSALPEVAATDAWRAVDAATLVDRSWYETWNGKRRALTIVVPADYASRGPLPLLVAAHPAGGASTCAEVLGGLPGRFGFVVACLDGQGASTRLFSYGAPGQISDLASAPATVQARLPRLQIDPQRVYLAGSSMGGMEALLVGLRYPLAYRAVVSLDGLGDLGFRFGSLPLNRRVLVEAECNGTPTTQARCFAERSPLTYLGRRPAGASRLVVWYSTGDPVSGAERQLPTLVAAQAAADPTGLDVRVGGWAHGALWDRADHRAAWLIDLGLLPAGAMRSISGYRQWSPAGVPTSSLGVEAGRGAGAGVVLRFPQPSFGVSSSCIVTLTAANGTRLEWTVTGTGLGGALVRVAVRRRGGGARATQILHASGGIVRVQLRARRGVYSATVVARSGEQQAP